MAELEPIYGVEFIPERQMHQVVLISTMEKACLVMPSAKMQAESIADSMNFAHYRALGQTWVRPKAMPFFVRQTKLGAFVDKEKPAFKF